MRTFAHPVNRGPPLRGPLPRSHDGPANGGPIANCPSTPTQANPPTTQLDGTPPLEPDFFRTPTQIPPAASRASYGDPDSPTGALHG